jgi:ribonuclease R
LTLGISNFLNRPLLEGITINIDPPGCKDIDDVITMKQIKEGLWNFAITIADVAEWVSINSDLDLEARKKGQTLYQNGTAVLPMFPLALRFPLGK